VILDILKELQVFFLLSRSHNGIAISVFKEVWNQSPDSVLFLNCIRWAFLFSQSILEVLFGCNVIPMGILKFQWEVSDHPEEWRKVTWKLLWIGILITLFCTNLKLIWEVHDEGKVLQSVLIYSAHWIINEIGAEEKSQEEDSGVMILILVEGTYAFAIHNEDF